MSKIKLIALTLLTASAFDNVNAFQDLEISKPFNFIKNSVNKLNIVNKPSSNNNIKQNIDDNMSVKSLSTAANSIVNGVKNTVNDLKVQLSVKDSINNLKNNLKGDTVTFNANKIKTSINKVENQNSFSINPIKKEKKENFTKQEKKKATKLIKNWVDNYLSKKNIKLFIANTDKKLKKYNEELKKPHSYNMFVLDKMLIDSALTGILKDNPHYQSLLRSNINYNILISLFALNANESKGVFYDIAKELDKHNFNLNTFTKIVDLYKKADIKINDEIKDKVKKEKQEKAQTKPVIVDKTLVKDNVNSFSIIGNKKKLNNEEYLPKLKTKLSSLNNDEKNALLDDLSEALAGGDDDFPNNFNINDKPVGQYLQSLSDCYAIQSSNNLSTDQKLFNIIVSLVKVDMLSYTINLLNPFSSGISLMSMMFQSEPTINSNSTSIVMFSKSYTSVKSYFRQTFDSMFSVIPSIGTLFTSSFLGW